MQLGAKLGAKLLGAKLGAKLGATVTSRPGTHLGYALPPGKNPNMLKHVWGKWYDARPFRILNL